MSTYDRLLAVYSTDQPEVNKIVCMLIGEISLPVHSDNQMPAYLRYAEGYRDYPIVLNLSHRPCFLRPKKISYTGIVVVSTSPETEGTRVDGVISPGDDEGMMVELETTSQPSG